MGLGQVVVFLGFPSVLVLIMDLHVMFLFLLGFFLSYPCSLRALLVLPLFRCVWLGSDPPALCAWLPFLGMVQPLFYRVIGSPAPLPSWYGFIFGNACRSFLFPDGWKMDLVTTPSGFLNARPYRGNALAYGLPCREVDRSWHRSARFGGL